MKSEKSEKSATAVYIFTRDFHTHDNLALHELKKHAEKIVPVFVLTDEQTSTEQNPYFSYHCYNFMIDALQDFQKTIPLTILKGPQNDVYSFLASRFDTVGIAKDYTKFALEREAQLRSLFKNVICTDTHFLFEPILNKAGKIYRVFTPFYRAVGSRKPKVINKKISFVELENVPKKFQGKLIHRGDSEKRAVIGTQKELKRLLSVQTNGYPTKLGAFIKFGLMSPRVFYNTINDEHFKRNMIWREFYYRIQTIHPDLLLEAIPNEQKNATKWYLPKAFENAKTQYPLINDIVTTLKETGYIPNRHRLIVSNYLMWDLGVHLSVGEKVFAKYLIDYDPVLNKGGWLWNLGVKMSIEIQSKKQGY